MISADLVTIRLSELIGKEARKKGSNPLLSQRVPNMRSITKQFHVIQQNQVQKVKPIIC